MRHAQMALSTVVTILILLVVAVLIFFSLNRGYSAVTEMFECDYCAPSCAVTQNGVPAGSDRFIGDSYCEDSTWDISDVPEKLRDQLFGTTDEEIPGDQLSCCSLRAEEVPDSYLTKDKRVGATEDIESEGDLIRPRVRAYFSEQALPVRNGENIDVVSEQSYDYVIEISDIGDEFKILKSDEEDSEKTFQTCRMRLFNSFDDNVLTINDDKVISVGTPQNDEDGPSGVNCKEFFTYKEDQYNSDEFTISIPSNFDGQSLRFEMSLTESESGRVNPDGADVLYRNTFNVINPIQFNNYDSNWVREQTLSVSCKGISCSRFFWAPGTCESPEDDFYQTQYSGEGRGFFTVNEELVEGNVGELNVCVIGETAGKNYTKTTPRSIGIDADPPSVRGTFNPLKMQTNITCTETNSQSGCAPRVGYHYIRRAVDFVGAAFTNDDASFCPDDLREYSFIPARQISQNAVSAVVPFTSGQDFMIMCVIAEDNAGNFDKDIVFNYNSYNILMTVVNSQLEEGGVGTGYHGYNYG